MPVSVVASLLVVASRGPALAAAQNAHLNPVAARRLFLMERRVMDTLRPEARVTGADPA